MEQSGRSYLMHPGVSLAKPPSEDNINFNSNAPEHQGDLGVKN